MSGTSFVIRCVQVFTCLWVFGWFAAILSTFHTWTDLSPNEIGDTLAGVFAPIAFAWLIAGFFQQSIEVRQGNDLREQQATQLKLQAQALHLQGKELADTRKTLDAQRDEMAKAADQAEAQAEAVRRNADHAAKDVYFQLKTILENDANGLLAQIAAGLEYDDGSYGFVIGEEVFDRIWVNYGNGDQFAFCNAFINGILVRASFPDELKGQSRKPTAIRKFRKVYEKLLDETDRVDDERRTLRAALEWSPMGDVYAAFSVLKPGKVPKFQLRDDDVAEAYRELYSKAD